MFFFPVLFSIVGGQLTNLTILLHQLNINLKLDCCPLSLSLPLSGFIYTGVGLVTLSRAGVMTERWRCHNTHQPPPLTSPDNLSLQSSFWLGCAVLGPRTGSLETEDSCRFMTVILLKWFNWKSIEILLQTYTLTPAQSTVKPDQTGPLLCVRRRIKTSL